MCPACVIGVIFIGQLLGFGRWFQKVVLKKPVENEEIYWKPESLLSSRMQRFYANKKKMILVYSIIAAEIIVAIVIFQHGGFMFFRKIWMMLQ